MRHFILRSVVLCSLALAACVAPDDGAEQLDETPPEAAISQPEGEDAQAYVRESFRSEDGNVIEANNGPGLGLAAALSASFWQTCRPYKYYTWSNGHIIRAYSDSCQRRNGTWGGPTFWSGSCGGDLANCNGVLRCGGC
jgi:hypothetical protein